MQGDPTVFLVDDDSEVRKSLQCLLESEGFSVRTFASAELFLKAYEPDAPGCVVVDLRMPGMSGLDLVRKMARQHWATPLIILTGYGDVPSAVRAMESGATAFIQKPFDAPALLDRIREALDRDARIRRERWQQARIRTDLASLTRRQREVMELVISGHLTKEIALQLGVSARTVEVHRANVMKKMGARSVAELVTVAVQYGLRGAGGEER